MTQQEVARDLANLAMRAVSALETFGAPKLARELRDAVVEFDKHDN